jgi:hypothetical protein
MEMNGKSHKEVLVKALKYAEVKKEYEALGIALTPEEMTEINRDMPIGAKYGDVFAEIARVQRMKVVRRLKGIADKNWQSDSWTQIYRDIDQLTAELEEK